MITFNLHIFKYILLYENLLFLFNNMIFFLKWINKIKGNRSFYFVLFVNLIVHLNIQVFSRSYISSFPNNNRYCNHATSHANSKAFGLLRRGLAPYSMWVVLGSYEFEDLRSSSSRAGALYLPIYKPCAIQRPSAFFIAGWRPIKKETNGILCE